MNNASLKNAWLENASLTRNLTIAWLGIFFVVLVWSGIRPHDYATWILEVLPALIALVALGATFKHFPLTRLVYFAILVHCIILMIGGHYTYAEVPLFDRLAEAFDQSRNNYDKVGHFAQGFVPVLVTREVFIRRSVINGVAWTHFISISFCLAVSAAYELIEWLVAVISEDAAESFLGTQGYVWDTQSDMAWALFGAITAVLVLGRLHDRQIERLEQA